MFFAYQHIYGRIQNTDGTMQEIINSADDRKLCLSKSYEQVNEKKTGKQMRIILKATMATGHT